MATLQELRAAIDHITACTGDPDAWRRNLSSADLAAVAATVIDPDAGTALLARIRANHPTLFDPRTGAPVTPTPTVPAGQSGEAVDAMKSAEDALVRQSSRTAEVDLQVITAIANAHSETEQGADRLRKLQLDIENAVRRRVDLDTPAGARDFQHYLIGKLREIGSVIESASLDSASKAALAGAWTALYRSAARPESASAPEPAPAGAPELPPYGVDVAGLAADNAGPADQTLPMAGASPPATPVAAPAPVMPLLPGVGAASPPAVGLTGGLPRSQPEPLSDSQFPGEPALPGPVSMRDREYDPLLDDGLLEPADDVAGADDADDAEVGAADEAPGETAWAPPDPGAATRVPLPDGSVVNAPSVTLANVMRATLAGTPIAEAFRAQGIEIPPPGSSVGIAIEPARVVAGDVGMFMEYQALALDSQRAWLRGQIQPVGAVTGPSFLGWLHPPAPSAVQTDTASPTTAPAAAPGTAR